MVSRAKDWRKQVFDVIEPLSGGSKASKVYDRVMIVLILVSFIPLFFHDESTAPLAAINAICATVFIIDYILRLMTADYRYKDKKHSLKSFLKYPLSLMAIIDLLSILSMVTALNSGLRLLRAARILRVMRIFRYSKSLKLLEEVLRRASRPLSLVVMVALSYIFIVAVVMFNAEPGIFANFTDALYWAVISMTTIGYGDIVPTTEMGRIITTISAIIGVAVIALPTSVLTAEYVNLINEYRSRREDRKWDKRIEEVERENEATQRPAEES